MCGVLQGSVLGPLLFLLYINDLPNITNKCNFTLFADDTTLTFKSENIDILEILMNETLELINEWLSGNKLVINIDKTSFIVFHRARLKLDLNIKLNNHTLKCTNEFKFLGVIFDDKRNWSKQIISVKNKLLYGLSVLHRFKFKFNNSTLMKLYHSFFHSHLNYCSIIWGSTYKSNIKCIQTLQNKCLRAIYRLDNMTNVDHLYVKHNILKFDDIVNVAIYKYMYKVYNSLWLHKSIANLFSFNTPLYTLRTKPTFLIPQIKCDNDKFSIQYKGSHL